MLELGYNDLIQVYLENHQVSHSTAKSQITKKKKKVLIILSITIKTRHDP